MKSPKKIKANLDIDVCCPFCNLTMYNYRGYLKCIRQECEGYAYKWDVPYVELTEKVEE